MSSAVDIKMEPREDEVDEKNVEAVARTHFADDYDRAQLPHLLRIYYTWLFPYDKYFDWLHYGE